MEGAMTKSVRWADLSPEQLERRKLSQLRYRERHPDRVKAAKKRWFDKNPEYFNEWSRKDYRRDPIKKLLRDLKTRAKKEGVPFNLKRDDIVIPKVCPILGVKLIAYGQEFKNRSNNSATMDRIVPSLGYVRGNVQVISFRANRLKNNATLDEIRKIVAYMEANNV
jgi:hypothetical protein